ncbi:hypothetical protein Q1695_005251 [Nippostrongylus brasiliensis]|nr:hypothetical protein Q1695_005251 [Nippostrongylus brasiliensis]
MLFIFYLSHQWRKTTQLPPGPYPIFLFGSLPQLMYYTWRHGGLVPALKSFKKKHGPVFTVWLGPIPTVHIADYKLSHEAMVRYGANYQDRWGPATMLVGRGGKGLLMSNGELWLEQRRFALQVLRNLGVSKNLMEERIMDEFNLRFSKIDSLLLGSPVDPVPLFDRLVGGVINRMLFSTATDEANEEKFHVLKKRFDGMIENVSLVDLFAKKWMTEFPLFNMKWKNVVNLLRELKTFVSGQIEERKRSIDNGSHSVDAEPCDYVDAFIKKMKEDERNGMDGSTFDEETLTMNVIDMWIAGQETTSTTLLWAMIYMLKHPQVVHTVREELLRVTDGGSRAVSLKDKPNTPYLTATIAEIQRHASIFNVNLNRLSATDTEIGGHPVPKNTIVTAQLSLILSDETLFSNAKVFDPSRFLLEPSLLSNVIPFGLGRRACLGESLAKAQLYLVIGNILLRYSIHSVGGSPPTGVANTFGIIKRPRPFRMTFSRLL